MLRCTLSDLGSDSATLEPVLGLTARRAQGQSWRVSQKMIQNSSPEHHGTREAQRKQSDSGCGLNAKLTGHADGWAVG